ncbi:phosphoglycerate mutase [Thermomonas sp.]|uniref:phosphoglycerate mutase n=1 Tax=Thermomonas sp. TaxID=1971895 RepID=UPI002635CC50|nr:phosphoglycerate mutase [Thermomonas sp.]
MTLLLPSTVRFASSTLPMALSKRLGRADQGQGGVGELALLARHFDVLPRGWPAAALTRLLDTGDEDVRLGAWLRVDPAHIRPDINGARLLGIGRTVGLDQDDVEALLPALKPLFGDFGFQLDAPHPTRWYLRLPREAKLPAFAAPEDALGDDIFDHLPDGPEARRWRILQNEVQVLLHNHPHNAARLASGRVAVNALWFWGSGVLPDALSSDALTIFSDDSAVQGAARLGKLQGMPLSAFQHGTEHDALVDLRGQRDPRQLLDAWLVPAARLADRRAVTFDFADGRAFHLRPGQRWRIWRRPLAELA